MVVVIKAQADKVICELTAKVKSVTDTWHARVWRKKRLGRARFAERGGELTEIEVIGLGATILVIAGTLDLGRVAVRTAAGDLLAHLARAGREGRATEGTQRSPRSAKSTRVPFRGVSCNDIRLMGVFTYSICMAMVPSSLAKQ